MRKTRFVNSIDYGIVRSDGKYSGSAADLTLTLMPDANLSLPTHYSYCASARYGPSAQSFIEQNEVFESTEWRKPRFNNCKHTNLKTVCLPFTTRSQYSTRCYTLGCRRVRSTSHAMPYMVPVDWSLVSSNMQAEAYHTMLPRFEGDISMINFIFEMKDFRDISTKIGRLVPRLLSDPTLVGSMSRASKRLAEVHLLKNFAIDPLIDDTASIIQQAQNLVMDVQSQFADSGINNESRHFTRQLNQSQSTELQSTLATYTGIHFGTKYEQTFTATMEGNYGYTMRSDIEAFIQYWGLAPTAEAVWNAIPFSFLVDYIFGIGHSLNVMRHDKNVKYNISQYCESILSTGQSGWFVGHSASPCYKHLLIDNQAYALTVNHIMPIFVTGTTSSYYERVVKQPYWGPYLPTWKIPNEKQFLNMAAILRCLL